MFVLLVACAQVQVTGEVDGYEPVLTEAIYVEHDLEVLDEQHRQITVIAVGIEDACQVLADYYSALREAEDEWWEATTEAQTEDALEEMNQAEQLLPASYWSSHAHLRVDSFGEGAVEGESLSGTDLATGEGGDFLAALLNRRSRRDWTECSSITSWTDGCGFDGKYYSDGGTALITGYSERESISVTIESEFRAGTVWYDVGSRVGEATLDIHATHCGRLQLLANEDEGWLDSSLLLIP